MAPSVVHLPNGQNLTVTPVFGGLYFKSNEWNSSNHQSPFPPGWTIVLNSEDDEDDEQEPTSDVDANLDSSESDTIRPARTRAVHRYRQPTLQNDHLYISSISNPNSHDFKPATSPTRQLAMMLWATLWWYFHQPEPNPRMTTHTSQKTAEEGKPKGEWRININREGIFKGRVVLAKLERMGLIASEDSSVGVEIHERTGAGWRNMFVSRRSFWQLDPRIYLFTLSRATHSPYPPTSPYSSRPSSPSGTQESKNKQRKDLPDPVAHGLWSPAAPGPFHSSSHLPTYFPPPPPQYVFTNGVRHPIRPKPPRQGETFYTRYIPSLGQYLSFRVATIFNKPLRHHGPNASVSSSTSSLNARFSQHSISENIVPTVSSFDQEASDLELLHKWMNNPRVSHFWGEQGPIEHQEQFLKHALSSKHSFPVIGCWDGKPFGYFELYWVKEDILGRHLGGDVRDYDRGIHCLVGEEEYRGPHRVKVWLSALVHYCWLADLRTETVMLEPRVDNEKLKKYCTEVGFFKEREVSFPHKQSNLMKIRRDTWEHPHL